MGFIKAFAGALGGSFANQWLEYMAPPATMRDHVLLARATAVKSKGSENNDGEENVGVITNGSKFLVPEGTCLITVENGAITAVISEPGGYTYTSENVPEAKSMFSGDGFFASTFGQSWNQFKFGGQPGNQQYAFYVNLKDVAGLRYGTQNPIRYKDANYANTMLAVTSNGTYTIKVVDPILLFKNLVPVDITSGQGRGTFELGGEGDTKGVEDSLFAGFVGSLAAALSAFTKGGKSIDDIQGGTVEFAKNMNEAVEANYQWATKYGLQIVNVQPMGLDWDEQSVELINKFNTGNLMQGGVGAAYAQTQIAEGFNAAGNNGGATNMMGMGMGVGMMGGMSGVAQPMGVNPVTAQQQTAQVAAPAPATPTAEPTAPAASATDATDADSPTNPETPAA